MDMMYRHYLDSIGEEDYILTKVRFYGEQSEKIKQYARYLESL